jgi:DNA-binding transcriptional MerR regulator
VRIGELAKLTDTPSRSLRYYEEQGLIIPERLPNGYRDYGDYLVDRVKQIRGLIDSGIPTRMIKQILPCLDKPRSILVEDAEPELVALLAQQRDRMSARIDVLARNRDAIDSYLEDVLAAVPGRGPIGAA